MTLRHEPTGPAPQPSEREVAFQKANELARRLYDLASAPSEIIRTVSITAYVKEGTEDGQQTVRDVARNARTSLPVAFRNIQDKLPGIGREICETVIPSLSQSGDKLELRAFVTVAQLLLALDDPASADRMEAYRHPDEPKEFDTQILDRIVHIIELNGLTSMYENLLNESREEDKFPDQI